MIEFALGLIVGAIIGACSLLVYITSFFTKGK